MDARELAQQLVTFLTPFLPYLVKMGEKAAEEAGKKLGADAWERAKALWGRLRGKERVVQAAQDLAASLDDPDAQAALRLQLKKALEADQVLAAEIARLWEEARAAGVTVIASGDRSVAIGGSVSGSTIVTGDQNVIGDRNVVQQGKYNVQIGQATGVTVGDQAHDDDRDE